jgi:signal transduction histidine kinase/DNA-binding response OmpR family regulator
VSLDYILADAGYAVHSASTVQEAVALAQGQAFDAAIVDISLPDGSGTEVLTALKQRHSDCVAIMVTGHASLDSSVQALNEGATGYVLKPVDMDELLLMLGEALQQQHLRAENQQMLRKLSVLYDIGSALAQSLDMEDTLTRVLRLLLDNLGGDMGAIWVAGTDEGQWTMVAHQGLPAHMREDGIVPVAADGRALAEAEVGATLRMGPNSPPEAAQATDGDGRQGCSLRYVPLRHLTELKGVMGVSAKGSRPPSAEDLELLAALGTQMGVAIQNMQLFDELRRAHERLQGAQEKLVRAEKLSATGQLVSGVAHELNNPLAVVIGFAQHLARIATDEAIKHACSRVYEQAKRCSRTLDHLLTFAREYAPEWRRVQMNEVIQSTMDLFAYKLRVRSIDVDLDLDADLPSTGGDPHKLQQVFVNIITNAFQSMVADGDGGRLTIRTTAGDGSIRVVFSDTGQGIAPEHLTRVFDPFFTTKDIGHGTGLGLSVSYGIIKEHGGEVTVESEQGKGATFTIDLPIRQAPEPEAELAADIDLSCCRNRRVLVVDDEEAVAELVDRILTRAGGEVHMALNGLAGKEKALAEHYDLLIADLKMPRMGGERFYEHLLDEDPRVAARVVFCTGDTMNDATTQFVMNSGRPFLTKPFVLEELAAVIREVLEE